MLCDQLMVELADASGCDIRPLLPRIQRAQKFVLGPEFAAVAESLSEDYGGLARIFDCCRLPYKDVWFEVLQTDRPHFMAAGMHIPQLQKIPKRIGFLLTATRDDLSAWKAHLYWNIEGIGCSTALLATAYDMTQLLHHETVATMPTDDALSRDQQIGPIKVKGFGAHEGWVQSSTDVRLSMINHTDLVAPDHHFSPVILQAVPAGKMDEFVQISRTLARADWAGEVVYLLAVIGLLNAKNAVEMESVDLTRLNRARVRNDKRQLFEHKILKINHRQVQRVYPDGKRASDHAPMRGHFVRGHFKQRRSGIYFWHPHARGDFHRGSISKDYEVET